MRPPRNSNGTLSRPTRLEQGNHDGRFLRGASFFVLLPSILYRSHRDKAQFDMTLPDLRDPDSIALFLDFDGTLVAIADRPDNVRLDPETRRALDRLSRLLSGALAIITGREIATVDRYLAPLHLPVAGVHGLTRRDAQGRTHAPVIDAGLAATVERAVAPLLRKYPDLLLERKFGAIALHYRTHPELEVACIEAMENAVTGLQKTEIKRGKMVIEAKAIAGDKGDAIADYLEETPFRGRRAVFAGDDATDEDAFELVNARGGASIKIGPGATQAAYRAAGTDAFLIWLRQLPAKLGG
jgi:trehalose 6-phosphate phosphatase